MKRMTCGFIMVALLLLLVGCGGDADPKTPTLQPSSTVVFDSDQFISLVSKSNDLISEQSVLLSNMGNYEYNYWNSLAKIGGSVDYEKIAQGGLEWLVENAEIEEDTIFEANETISDQYKSILSSNPAGAIYVEITDKYKSLYEAYTKLYKTVTAPSGSIDSFITDFNDSLDDVQVNSELLVALLLD